MEYKVKIQDLVNEYELKQLNPDVTLEGKTVEHSDVNRLALQLTGFLDYFDPRRVQIIGKVESTFLEQMPEKEQMENICTIFKMGIPCLIYCRGEEPSPRIFDCSITYDIPILQTDMETSEFASDVIRWLRVQLAPRVTIHGVFVDIYGEGVLIMGESGIGKSETALELIKRGHRLVADDAVEIKKVSTETLIGTCPEVIRHLIELRGIGIIDIHQMFGVESIMMTQSVDLIIKMTDWEEENHYDRLGLDEEYIEILGNKVVCHTIPIRPGRNLAIICEAAAINHRQKKMGYNAAEELELRLAGKSTGYHSRPATFTSLPSGKAVKVDTIGEDLINITSNIGSISKEGPFE